MYQYFHYLSWTNVFIDEEWDLARDREASEKGSNILQSPHTTMMMIIMAIINVVSLFPLGTEVQFIRML
jgi:hypothetical protein